MKIKILYGIAFSLAFLSLIDICICLSNETEDKLFLLKIIEGDRANLDLLLSEGYDIAGFKGEEVFIISDKEGLDNLRNYGYSPQVIEIAPEKALEALSENLGSYHTYTEANDELFSLEARFSNISKVYEVGRSIENRPIYGIKISDNPEINENEPAVLIVGCHHSREIISVEVPLYFANYLLEDYSVNSKIKYLIENREVWIVPMLNPDGHIRVANGDYDWRKNLRDNGDGSKGVDLNRNYNYMWGWDEVGSSGYGWNDIYRGEEPFSEPETISMRELIDQGEFRTSLSYHSYGSLLLFPWGYTRKDTEDHDLFLALARELTIGSEYEIGNAKSGTIYLTNGGMDDWLYGGFQKEKKVLGYTVEVGEMFIPSDNVRVPLCKENVGCCLTSIESAGFYTELSDMKINDTGGNGDEIIEPGESGLISIRLKNKSIDDLFNVQMSLYSSSPAITIENQHFLVNFLPALQETPEDEINFNFSAASISKRFEKVNLTLDMKSTDGLQIIEDVPIWITSISDSKVKFGFDFSLNPGWISTGSWKHGVLPASDNGRTSPNKLGEPIYATDFYGNFPPRSRSILTSSPLDMSDLIYTKLKFKRWLNVPNPLFAKASVQISDDGIIWHEIWVNDDRINDTGWNSESLDISRFCDRKKEILIRWTLSSYSEVTDSGWRIDDVEIEGITIEESTPAVIPLWMSYNNAYETAILLDNISDNLNSMIGFDVYNHDGNKITTINYEMSGGETKIFTFGNYASNCFGWSLLNVPDHVISQVFLLDFKNSQVIQIKVQKDSMDSPIRIPFWQNSDSNGYKTYFVIIDRDSESSGNIKFEFFNNIGQNINSTRLDTEKNTMLVFEVADFVDSNSYGSAFIEHDSSQFTFWGFILNTNNWSIMPINFLDQ